MNTRIVDFRLVVLVTVYIVIIAGCGYCYSGGQYLRLNKYRDPDEAWIVQNVENFLYLAKLNNKLGLIAQDKLASCCNAAPGYVAARWKFEFQTDQALTVWDYHHWKQIFVWLQDQNQARDDAYRGAGVGALIGLGSAISLIYIFFWLSITCDRRKLARKTKAWFLFGVAQIKCAAVPLEERRNYAPNIFISGRMGAGKSAEDANIIDQWRKAGRSAVIVDYNFEKIRKFWRPGDKLINPFVRYGVRYSILAEAREVLDRAAVAEAFFPPSDHEVHNHFQIGGRQILQEVLEACNTNLEIWKLLHDRELIIHKLKQTPAKVFLEAGHNETASFLTTMMAGLSALQYFPAGAGHSDFAVRGFVRAARNNPGPILWVALSERQRVPMAPIISVIGGIVIAEALNFPDANPQQRLLLGLDELGQIPVISRLGAALTAGRKPGLFILADVQHVSQAERKYGNEWKEIFGGFGTKLVLGQPDAEGAEFWSRELGTTEVTERRESSSYGPNGQTKGWSEQVRMRARVLPHELQELPNLHGYLQLSHHPAARVRIKYRKRADVCDPGPSWNRRTDAEPSAGEALRMELSTVASPPTANDTHTGTSSMDLNAFGI